MKRPLRIETLERRQLLTTVDLSQEGFGSDFDEFNTTTVRSLDAQSPIDTITFTAVDGDVINVGVEFFSGSSPLLTLSRVTENGPDELLWETDDSMSFLPKNSVLAAGVDLGLAYVVEDGGTYKVELSPVGQFTYEADFLILRPGLERTPPGTHQVIFLDFESATLNPSQTFPAFSSLDANVGTTPFVESMAAWGLGLVVLRRRNRPHN